MKANVIFFWCSSSSSLTSFPGFVLMRLAEEFMEQLRPIFEALRQREELPCSYPLHVGSTHGTKQAFIYGHSRSQGSTTPGAHHYTHHHGYQPSPGYHWVMLSRLSKCGGCYCTLNSVHYRSHICLCYVYVRVFYVLVRGRYKCNRSIVKSI